MQRLPADRRDAVSVNRNVSTTTTAPPPALRYASRAKGRFATRAPPVDCTITINPGGQFYVSPGGQFRMSLDTIRMLSDEQDQTGSVPPC
jgi:hypothetical protein